MSLSRQFTATVYILHCDQVLLHFHGKIGKWLPPGGHIEENETPPECAKREVLEETGLEIEFLKDEHLWIDYFNANSIERPFLCLLENIPAHGSSAPHQHIDLIYVGTPVGGALSETAVKETQARWFTLEEVMSLSPDQEIFRETQDTIQKVFEWAAKRQSADLIP